jgi:hypothetical protein
MPDNKSNVCFIRIRAVMGIGASDTFTPVEVPNEGELEQTLEAVYEVHNLSNDYADTDAYIKGFAMPEVVKTKTSNYRDAVSREIEELEKRIGRTPAVYVVKESDTEPSMDECVGEPSLEYSAVWAPNRKEWIGLKVKRTKIYEGVWQGIDQMVGCEGPFRLSEEWSQKILEAYKSSQKISPQKVLRTNPSDL